MGSSVGVAVEAGKPADLLVGGAVRGAEMLGVPIGVAETPLHALNASALAAITAIRRHRR